MSVLLGWINREQTDKSRKNGELHAICIVNKICDSAYVHDFVHENPHIALISLLLPVVKLGENDYIYVTIKPQFQTMLHDSYFTLSFIARKARALRNGEYPIFVRITVSGQVSEMNIGRSVAPENWDQKRAMSKGRSRRDLELNKYIEVVKARFLEIHNMLVREGKMVNPKILRDHFLGTVEKPKMLCDVFRQANEQRRAEYERGDMGKATYERWVRCVAYLEEFMQLTMNVPDMPVKDVTKGFVQDFEHFLRMNKKAANNTAVRYLRYLKNVMQYAIANKWATEDPFLGKRFKRTVADREALTEAELKRMMDLDLKDYPRVEAVRDTFVFCCFTGLSFADMRNLTEENIRTYFDEHEWININRQKTGVVSNIRLLDIAKRIIDKYRGLCEDGRIFPVPHYMTCLYGIRAVAKCCGITKHITWHQRRHYELSLSLKLNILQRFVS